MSIDNWLVDVDLKVKQFLEHQRSKLKDGYYHYTYSSDLYNEEKHWNVGSSCFALKLYYSLNINDKTLIEPAAEYIKSFIKKDKIFDPLVFKRSFFRNFISSCKHRKLDNFLNQNYIRAETRQCLSSLSLYNLVPGNFDIPYLKTISEIDLFMNKLNWNLPWSAGSHFSHMLFFINLAHEHQLINKQEYENLTSYALLKINALTDNKTGCWGRGNIDLRNYINGAMKIITGMHAINNFSINFPEHIIDSCLGFNYAGHACDNFNIVYVLNKLNSYVDGSYRKSEIERFMREKLITYRNHYKMQEGGFSFNLDSVNTNYYGLKLASAKDECDIHGTVLFVWGLALINQTLDLNLTLREFKT